MLIDDNHKCIFIHIPKNAGSSMTQAFQRIGARKSDQYDTHVPCTTISKDMPEKFNNYFKFAFVRNPWDRLYSMYKFTVRRGWCSKDVPFCEWILKDAITEACKYQEPIVPIQQKSQLDWITDSEGNTVVDFIGRFENLNQDFNKICNQIGSPMKLVNINASPGKPYREEYTEEAKRFVEEHYAKDIEVFNYEF